MLVRQALVQGAVDGESTYAAVKDANGKGSNFGLRISDCGFQVTFQAQVLNPKFEFRNPKFKNGGGAEN